MKALGLIPARYQSTRLPGKPLAPIGGLPMVVRVYRRVQPVFAELYVVTDSEIIAQACLEHGCACLVSQRAHESGTSRCAEALEILRAQGQERNSWEVVVNVQGDEPFIDPEPLRRLVMAFESPEVSIATLVRPFRAGEEVANPNRPKVALSSTGEALYFSRAVIPYYRNVAPNDEPAYWAHIGVYAYRPAVLARIAQLPPAPLEQAESLEQLRWLNAGLRIQTVAVEQEGLSVDTPEDLARAQHLAAREENSHTSC